jgi:hypothetical protein
LSASSDAQQESVQAMTTIMIKAKSFMGAFSQGKLADNYPFSSHVEPLARRFGGPLIVLHK